MARVSLFQSAALAVLAAFGTMSVPAQAQDQDQDRQEARAAMREARQEMRAERQASAPQQAPERQARQAPPMAAPEAQTHVAESGGQNWNRGGGDGNGRQGRAEARRQQQQSAPQPQPQPQAQAEDGGRKWNRGGGDGGNDWQSRAEARQQRSAAPQQRSAPDGGWRSQRASDGQRYGRNWDNSGAVSRPAPAYRGETPPAPERGSADGSRRHHDDGQNGEWSGQRNRTYADPNRSSGYRGDRGHDRTADSWRDSRGDRNGASGVPTYRDGRTADNYRDRRDQNYVYGSRYSSSSRDHRRWDHNDWRRDTRYNWSGYRTQHRDLYRAGRYYSPYSNYGYSRLSIGFFLNSGFYGQNYWINDPYQYRLPAVYGPYRWVRYYDDVLLVDIYSGEVVDVIHDFFW